MQLPHLRVPDLIDVWTFRRISIRFNFHPCPFVLIRNRVVGRGRTRKTGADSTILSVSSDAPQYVEAAQPTPSHLEALCTCISSLHLRISVPVLRKQAHALHQSTCVYEEISRERLFPWPVSYSTCLVDFARAQHEKNIVTEK